MFGKWWGLSAAATATASSGGPLPHMLMSLTLYFLFHKCNCLDEFVTLIGLVIIMDI